MRRRRAVGGPAEQALELARRARAASAAHARGRRDVARGHGCRRRRRPGRAVGLPRPHADRRGHRRPGGARRPARGARARRGAGAGRDGRRPGASAGRRGSRRCAAGRGGGRDVGLRGICGRRGPWARNAASAAAMSNGLVLAVIGPSQPSRKPTNSNPCSATPFRTTARITQFRPGASPPPVKTPTRMLSSQASSVTRA